MRSFSEKAEFTHHAKPSFERLIAAQDYKAMNDNERFGCVVE